jgi:hypothetical protein
MGAADDVEGCVGSGERRTWRTYLLYLLPILHLGVCLAVWLTHDAEYIIMLDFPWSVLFIGLGYRGVSLSIDLGILVIIGTLWWYLLSLGIRRVVRFVTGHL